MMVGRWVFRASLLMVAAAAVPGFGELLSESIAQKLSAGTSAQPTSKNFFFTLDGMTEIVYATCGDLTFVQSTEVTSPTLTVETSFTNLVFIIEHAGPTRYVKSKRTDCSGTCSFSTQTGYISATLKLPKSTELTRIGLAGSGNVYVPDGVVLAGQNTIFNSGSGSMNVNDRSSSITFSNTGSGTILANAATITSVTTSGSGGFSGTASTGADSTALTTSGSGGICASLPTTKELQLSSTGSGAPQATSSNQIDNLIVSSSGQGGANACVPANDCKITLTGSGSVAVDCNATLTGLLSGSGGITNSGSAPSSVDDSGSGSVSQAPCQACTVQSPADAPTQPVNFELGLCGSWPYGAAASSKPVAMLALAAAILFAA